MPVLPRRPLGRPGFRFEIRPCDVAAVPGAYEATEESRERLAPWMNWMCSDYGRQDTENWIARSIQEWDEGGAYEFVIYDREDGAVAGACGLNRINALDRFCNLGYWVRTAKARRGAATQAVALLREFAFDAVGLNRLEIVVAEGNRASRAVAEKAGALYEGLQRRRICVRGAVQDAHMYALIRPDL